MEMTGQKIIDGLRDAVAGNFVRATIDGQTWVRDTGWQPIETAPKDIMIMTWDGASIDIAKWAWEDSWIGCDGPSYIPTHWRHLPPPPETEGK